MFVNDGHELFVAQSFAKNMGLYSNQLKPKKTKLKHKKDY